MKSVKTRNNSTIYLDLIRPEESKVISNFVRPIFCKSEPLNQCLNIENTPRDYEALGKNFEQSIKAGCCIKAVDKDGKTIGVLLNYIAIRDAKGTENEEVSENFAKILKLFTRLDASYDLFEKYPNIQRVFCNDVAAVSTDWQSQGIATILINYAKELAVKNSCRFIKAHCTSYYANGVLERLGYKAVYVLKYEDYTIDGEIVFTPQKPHVYVKLYIFDTASCNNQ